MSNSPVPMSPKSNSPGFLVLFVGGISLLAAIALLCFAIFMAVLGTPIKQSAFMGAIAIVPSIIAIACLVPGHRSLAIRIMGFLVLLLGIGLLGKTLVEEKSEGEPRTRIGFMLLLVVSGGVMAWKGKWPGEAAKSEPVNPSDLSRIAAMNNLKPKN